MDQPSIALLTPSQPTEMEPVRAIFREYGDSLGIDLEFQGFDAELAELPGDYARRAGRSSWPKWAARSRGAAPSGRWTPPTTRTRPK